MSGSKKCAIYLRVSRTNDSQSVDNQRPDVEQLASARGLEVVHVYEEQSSAAKHRPEHERMMRDARRGAFTVLVVWALDRFGRSMIGNMQDVTELDRIGVTVVSVRESWLDTGGPVRALLIAIFSGALNKSALASSSGPRPASLPHGDGASASAAPGPNVATPTSGARGSTSTPHAGDRCEPAGGGPTAPGSRADGGIDADPIRDAVRQPTATTSRMASRLPQSLEFVGQDSLRGAEKRFTASGPPRNVAGGG